MRPQTEGKGLQIRITAFESSTNQRRGCKEIRDTATISPVKSQLHWQPSGGPRCRPLDTALCYSKKLDETILFSGLDSRIQRSSSNWSQGNGHDEAIDVNVTRRVRVASSPNDDIFHFFSRILLLRPNHWLLAFISSSSSSFGVRWKGKTCKDNNRRTVRRHRRPLSVTVEGRTGVVAFGSLKQRRY